MKAKPKPEPLPSDWRNLRVPVAYGIALVIGVVGGWAWLHETFAPSSALAEVRGQIVVAQVQIKSIYDVRIEQLRVQRDRLLRLQRTPQVAADIADVERELDLARKMRDAQKIK